MARRYYRLEKVLPHRLGSDELLEAVRLHPDFDWQAARLWVYADEKSKASQAADVLYREETGRAGLSWGPPAVWTDCDDIEEAVRLLLRMSAETTGRGGGATPDS